MRVCLIQPSNIYHESVIKHAAPFLPLGLGILAQRLSLNKHKVLLLDCYTEGWELRGRIEDQWIEIGTPEEEIAISLRRFKPQIVGFSVSFSTQLPRLRTMARWVKAIHPEIFVICGGALPTAIPQEILEIPEVDTVVCGEGENTLVSLLDRLESGIDFQDLSGIAYYNQRGDFIRNPMAESVQNLDTLPLKAYDFLPLKKYFRAVSGQKLPLLTSRGCSQECSYCYSQQLFGDQIRYQSVERMVQQIKHLRDSYGVREFFFDDDAILLDLPRLHELCNKMIQGDLRIQWSLRNGLIPDEIPEELLLLIKRSGGKRLQFLVGSGSRRVLQTILRRNVNLYALEKLIANSLKNGLRITCNFLLGHPGETLEEVYETLNYAWKLRSLGVDDFRFSLAYPFQGTELRAQADALNCVYAYPESKFASIEGLFSTSEFSAAEIAKICETAELEFRSRGLMAEFARRMAIGKQLIQKPAERFFLSVAPTVQTRRMSIPSSNEVETSSEVHR
ncbi:MAG: radical SAM protein [bacterium]